MSGLRIETLTLGAMGTNCYLVMEEETRELLVIDPGDWPERIVQKIGELEARPIGIFLTHGHFDHVGAVRGLKDRYNIPVHALEEEVSLLASGQLNLSVMFGKTIELEADVQLRDGQELELLGSRMRVLHTPGHTQGGACFYFPQEGILFSGDTLFCESVGRSDFPTGSMSVLVRSVREKLMSLPEKTSVFPGHGEETSIGHEKKYNPFL